MSKRIRSDYGRRLIPSLIDEIAQNDPLRIFAVHCTSSGSEYQARNITFKEFSRAINRAAWWLQEELGTKGINFPTIGYIGPSDIRYGILAVSANKAGYKVLFPSPRNSVAYHTHILREAKCNTMLRDSCTDIKNIQEENRGLRDIILPDVDYFFRDDAVKDYPYHETAQSFREPTIVLHSSGSTGPPKVIVWTQETLTKFDAQHDIREGESVIVTNTFNEQSCILNTFPMFHATALIFSLAHSCYYSQPSVFPPVGQVKASTIIDAVDNLDLKLLAIAPSILEEIAHDEKALQKLQGREIFFGGSPLADSAGEILCKHCKLNCMIGTTESCEFPCLEHDLEDWNYFRFPAQLKGLDFRKHNDELYELVFVRDEETDRYHSTWITFPDLQEYSTKDLYAKHPEKPGHWIHRGRSDDTIAMSNGEKFVPIPYELSLKENKIIRDALLIGQGKFEVSLLIEVKDEYLELDLNEVLRRVIPTVKSINSHMPRFARISQERILFTSREKPMVRAGKGSVIRTATLKLYNQEITNLYEKEAGLDPKKTPLLKSTTLERTVASLISILCYVSELTNDIDQNIDFFKLGFDSLNVMSATRNIKAILQAEGNEFANTISPSFIYSHSTVRDLAEALRSLGSKPQDQGLNDRSRIQEMENMLAKYSAGIKEAKLGHVLAVADKLNVILTGSTGSLGSYLLDSLCKSANIATVFAINRSDHGRQKQMEACSARKLNSDFGKVIFIQADLGKPDLGISKDNYVLLRDSVHFIIHNAWEVDFNLSLGSMEPHVAGIHNLIDLSVAGRFHPYITFTSSVGTLGSYAQMHPEEPAAPEAIFNDSRIPQPLGYTMSKQIGERLLNVASEKTSLRTSVSRLGQIAGPVRRLGGVWNKSEWLPSLIISSAYLKSLPSDIAGDIDWLPVDILADTLVDICIHDVGPDAGSPENRSIVYNLINPKAVSWHDLSPTILENLPAESKMVSLIEWVEVLRKSSEAPQVDTVRNPAVKLLEFFENLSKGGQISAKMQVANATKISKSLREIEAVNEEWMKSWMNGWGLTTY